MENEGNEIFDWNKHKALLKYQRKNDGFNPPLSKTDIDTSCELSRSHARI